MIKAVSKEKNFVTEITNGRGHSVYSDVNFDDGGSNLYERPGELLASAYAACMNITARKLLKQKGITDCEVVTEVEMDRSNPDKTVFYANTEIKGDISQEDRQDILREIKNCPVCRILKGEKEFLDLNCK